MKLSTAAKVGIITIVSLIALSALIIWKTDFLNISSGYELRGSFNSIEGLTIGSEIRYRGFKIGKVMRIDPGPYEIAIDGVIYGGIEVPDDSKLRISYDGLVGLKYLEIIPGVSTGIYQPPSVLYGIKTSGIVDFIDIGSQNLVETKKILENIRAMLDDPALKRAFTGTVFTANQVAQDMQKLTAELRETNKGIREIVADPAFQKAVKGTIKETEKTLTSANRFFDSVGSMNVRVSGGVDLGTVSNAVGGNVDIVQSDRGYFRLGIGEGPSSRQISLKDVLFNSKIADDVGFRLGVINNQLGGGIALYPSKKTTFRGDVYDINNADASNNRLWPKLRLGYEYELREYMDMAVRGDDLLNPGNRNLTIGITVKPLGARIY